MTAITKPIVSPVKLIKGLFESFHKATQYMGIIIHDHTCYSKTIQINIVYLVQILKGGHYVNVHINLKRSWTFWDQRDDTLIK